MKSVEVDQTATGSVETLVNTAKQLPELASQEQGIRLCDRLKPTIHRRLVHGADFKQAITIVGPSDGIEQSIFASLFVPILYRGPLEIISEIQSERSDDCFSI